MRKGNGDAGADQYERQSVACDVAVLVFDRAQLRVLLIRRRNEPFAGRWALPGGFLDRGETLAEAAAREVREETGISRVRLREVGAFGDPGRDPRGRTISIAWLALARLARLRPEAGDDAGEVGWFPLKRPPELAFDHAKILTAVREELRHIAVCAADLFDLLPRRFTADDYRQLCREVMGRRYDAVAFVQRLAEIPSLRAEKASGLEPVYNFDRRLHRRDDFVFLLGDK